MTDNPFDPDYRAPEASDEIERELKPAAKAKSSSTIRVFPDLVQGSEEWHAARCGLLTASEMKLIITPTLKVASNDKEKTHLYELLGQRITGFVEPSYISDDMLRGHEDEIDARMLYAKHFAPVTEAGFITNNKWGFTIGYSPDGLVGDDGLIECKSRRQKYQIQTICEGIVPTEYMLQLQTGLLVTERSWIDYISYSGGLAMFVTRIEADPVIQKAIIEAATAFEERLADKEREYRASLAAMPKMIPTERRVYEDIIA
jgi:hypothetical protein